MRWVCKQMATLGPTWPLVFIEPFYGGSHKQLVDLLAREFRGDLFTLPASKWHWRSRVSALSFAHILPAHHNYKVLFCSSVLNLCELVALRPDFASLHKILYFHENQLVYPVRKQQERDFQYGYNQILSCLVADSIVFNSHFNMDSFLDGIDSHLRLMPDSRPRGLANLIRPKCRVLYFPLDLPPLTQVRGECSRDSSVGDRKLNVEEDEGNRNHWDDSDGISGDPQPLHIVWPHRWYNNFMATLTVNIARDYARKWEHDKGPEEFCAALMKLFEAKKNFKVSFLGSHTSDIPECISEAQLQLGQHVVHYGPLERQQYWQALQQADVAVSTAKHEFFGVAMMEAVACGCYPLCPNRLVYPEMYPSECLYNTEQQLYKRLAGFCDRPWVLRQRKAKVDLCQFSWSKLKIAYNELLDWTNVV